MIFAGSACGKGELSDWVRRFGRKVLYRVQLDISGTQRMTIWGPEEPNCLGYANGFEACAPKRILRYTECWLVERTFGWLNLFRRLAKDEYQPDTGETMALAAKIHAVTKRLAAMRSGI